MRKIYGLLISLFLTHAANAQVFAPIGAEWHYTNIESFFMPNQGYEKITVVGDTVIQGKPCRKLERVLTTTWNGTYTLPTEYLHISGDTVFRMAPDTTFSVLYNFGAQPGDSWIIQEWHWNPEPGLIEITAIVEEVTIVQVNGQHLRQLKVSTNHFLSFGNPKTVTEKLGGTNFMFLENYAFSDSDIRVDLRCYSDPTFGDYQSNPSIGCTQLITTWPSAAAENNPVFLQKTFPNPTAGSVTVQFPDIRQAKTLRIFDALGRQVQLHQLAPEATSIEVHLPSEGLYLFQTDLQGQVVFSQRVVRE